MASQHLLVLYASQTGCAQDVAERVVRGARSRNICTLLRSMDDYDKARLIHEQRVVFVCSTAGQGDEPDTMKAFWRFLLRKAHPNDILSNLEFTVFGLGDSSYENYNFPAKKLHKRLLQLGAYSFYPKGEGDDQHYQGIDGTLDPWLIGLWKVLCIRYPDAKEPEPVQSAPPSRYKFIRQVSTTPIVTSLTEPTISSIVVQNDRLTAPDHFQDVRHISLRLPSDVRYSPGDVACVLPQNDSRNITELINYMQWQDMADEVISLAFLDDNSNQKAGLFNDRYVGRPTTLRYALTRWLSPFSTPRRYFFELLAHFATDEQQQEKLQEFASTYGHDALQDYALRPKRTCFEVLQDFTTCKFPPEYVFDLFQEMRGRQFSIASAHHSDDIDCDNSFELSTIHLELCVAVVQYKTKLHIPRAGVCTTWLSSLAVGDVVPIKIKRGTFRLPKNPSAPVICIGPGTGIAPMKSLIEARVLQGARNNYLFFGSRNASKDFYYGHLWTKLVNSGSLRLFTAFSRDQPGKMYVQHSIRLQSALVYDLIVTKNAYVFLSGNANRMPIDVRDSLVTILQTEGNMTLEAAQAYLVRMIRDKRYQEESW